MIDFNTINTVNFREIVNDLLEKKYLNKQTKFVNQKKIVKNTDCILVETLLADIMLDKMHINPEYCEKINLWAIKGIYGYISVDPSFNIKINGLENEVSYIFNGITIIGRLPLDPHPQIISNFSYFSLSLSSYY